MKLKRVAILKKVYQPGNLSRLLLVWKMMNIFQYSQIGDFHTNHNEDNLYSGQIGNDKLLIAVMDGCSMGTESHFASTLVKKLLKKITKELYYQEFALQQSYTTQEILYLTFQNLFKQLRDLMNQLALDKYELLTTVILGIVNLKDRSAEILTIGDGAVNYNGDLIVYEQDNQPDYLGYHLTENYEKWYSDQVQRLSLSNIEDLSLVTDGIFTFQKFDIRQAEAPSQNEITHLLLKDQIGIDNEQMLKKKLIRIEEEYGLRPSDDLSIIRIILND